MLRRSAASSCAGALHLTLCAHPNQPVEYVNSCDPSHCLSPCNPYSLPNLQCCHIQQRRGLLATDVEVALAGAWEERCGKIFQASSCLLQPRLSSHSIPFAMPSQLLL